MFFCFSPFCVALLTQSSTGFPEEHPSSGFTAGLKDVKIATEGAFRQKMSSQDCQMRRKIPCKQRFEFVNCVVDVCSLISRLIAQNGAHHDCQRKVLKLNPSGRSSRGVTDLRISPTLRRLSWNHSCSRDAVSKDCADLPFRGNHSLTRPVLTPMDAKDCRDFEKTQLGFSPRRTVQRQWNFFFWRYCTNFKHQIFPDSGPKKEEVFSAKILMLSHGQKHKKYCCHTTIFVILFLELVPEALQQLARKFQPSLFSSFCPPELQPEAFADQGWRSKMSCQRTTPQTFVGPSQVSNSTGAPARSRESASSSKSTVSKVSLACLHLPEHWSHRY